VREGIEQLSSHMRSHNIPREAAERERERERKKSRVCMRREKRDVERYL
jgi:hypothetical protein